MQQHEPSVLSLPHRIVRGLAVLSANNTGWGHEVWLAMLVAASAAFSFVFACATPFAAFGAAAALTLSRRDALRLTVAVWLANQVLGYAVLKYPWTANSFAWGAVLAVAVAWLGGTESFTPLIVGRIFSVNVVALIGLSALHRVGVGVGLIGPSTLRLSAAGGTA